MRSQSARFFAAALQITECDHAGFIYRVEPHRPLFVFFAAALMTSRDRSRNRSRSYRSFAKLPRSVSRRCASFCRAESRWKSSFASNVAILSPIRTADCGATCYNRFVSCLVNDTRHELQFESCEVNANPFLCLDLPIML